MHQLRELARFLPALENPDFKAGSMVVLRESKPGVFCLPYATYSDIATDFISAAYEHGWVLRDFNWPEWAQSTEAGSLRDDQTALARATPEQIARLLTVVIRQDRFVEGALLTAFKSGVILHIVRRAAAILEADESSFVDPSKC